VLAGSGTSLAWYDRLHVALVPFPQARSGGSIGVGYITAYAGLSLVSQAAAAGDADFVAQLQRVLEPGVPLIVAGHGFGGALATVYVVDAVERAGLVPAEVVTFGSPRVGDAAFVSAYAALGVPTLRVANYRDLAQRVPAADYNYSHVGTPKIVDSLGVAQLDHDCTHAMATYLHLLDATRTLGGGCAPTGPDAQMAAYVRAVRHTADS
jgi:triacylglycerol lipase